MSEDARKDRTISGELVLPKLNMSLTVPAQTEVGSSATPPPPIETQHELTIGEQRVAYRARAGLFALRDDEGKERARLFHTAYFRSDVEDLGSRPLVFAFNGGPGSSSVWLHLGAWGPRRVSLGPDGEALPPPARLVDNPHSLLDVADLVFIDPVGTGFSKPIEGVDGQDFWNVEGDIESVAAFIAQFTTQHKRWRSPVFLAGESYGTMRSAGLARELQAKHGLYLTGVILVSTVLNMATIRFADGNDLPYVLYLPSYAATAHYHRALGDDQLARPLSDFLSEVEHFARDEYHAALLWGDELPAERFESVAARLHTYTGLPVEYLKAARLRIEMGRFNKELLRSRSQTVGRLDSRYLGTDRHLVSDSYEYDPSGTALSGAFAGALQQYLADELSYQNDSRYQILASLYESWGYGKWSNTYLDLSEPLREAMTHNPSLRVLFASGYYDLATPYFASDYTVSHLALGPDLRQHVQTTYYEAGHMMYVKESEALRLAADVRAFIAG